MTDLSKKIGEMDYDGLFAGLTPPKDVQGGTIRKLAAAATLKRGTILAKSTGAAGDGKLVVLGTAAAKDETLTPDSVLCDDIAVGTTDDEKVAVYTAGCFSAEKLTVASGYTISQSDFDNLRMRGIVVKAVTPGI